MPARHHRGLVMQRARVVLGEGLLTSEVPLHLRQRRLAQPAFHRQRIASYGQIIAGYAAEMSAALGERDGDGPAAGDAAVGPAHRGQDALRHQR